MPRTQVEPDHRAKRIIWILRDRGGPALGGALQCSSGGLRRQILLGLKLLVEGALGEPGPLHQILEPYAVKAALPEEPAGHVDHCLTVLSSLNATNAHRG